MVVRLMLFRPISQCSRHLDFHPRVNWPSVLPAVAWRGHLLCGFERMAGEAVELERETSLAEALKALYAELGLSQIARLMESLTGELESWREPVCTAFGLRWSDRLQQTCKSLLKSPREFQNWVDEKKVGARDLAPLLALDDVSPFSLFLKEVVALGVSKAEGVRIVELGVELYLMGRSVQELLPANETAAAHLRRLEQWRRPMSAELDEGWKKTVAQWPWPSQVQGQWQRFGDQSGIEIKIRTTSPSDLLKKLERLNQIGESWSCKS